MVRGRVDRRAHEETRGEPLRSTDSGYTMSSSNPHPNVRKLGGPPARLALRREEAASAIGVSLDFYERHIEPELPLIRRGTLKLVAVAALTRWLDENSTVLPAARAA